MYVKLSLSTGDNVSSALLFREVQLNYEENFFCIKITCCLACVYSLGDETSDALSAGSGDN